MPDPHPPTDGSRPGVMGDWSEEQNLGQPGHPEDRITEDDVEAAFDKDIKALGQGRRSAGARRLRRSPISVAPKPQAGENLASAATSRGQSLLSGLALPRPDRYLSRAASGPESVRRGTISTFRKPKCPLLSRLRTPTV